MELGSVLSAILEESLLEARAPSSSCEYAKSLADGKSSINICWQNEATNEGTKDAKLKSVLLCVRQGPGPAVEPSLSALLFGVQLCAQGEGSA